MAKYKSKYSELSFYAGGKLKSFSNGFYITEDKEEIEVLSGITDAELIDEPATEEAPAKPKATPKKAPAKASAK